MKCTKESNELNVLTAQLVSQLMYCSSRLQYEEFHKISKEMMDLISKYQTKVRKIQDV